MAIPSVNAEKLRTPDTGAGATPDNADLSALEQSFKSGWYDTHCKSSFCSCSSHCLFSFDGPQYHHTLPTKSWYLLITHLKLLMILTLFYI